MPTLVTLTPITAGGVPAHGPDLTADAAQTLLWSDGVVRRIQESTLTEEVTLTASSTASEGNEILILRYDTSMNSVLVKDGVTDALIGQLGKLSRSWMVLRFEDAGWYVSGKGSL